MNNKNIDRFNNIILKISNPTSLEVGLDLFEQGVISNDTLIKSYFTNTATIQDDASNGLGGNYTYTGTAYFSENQISVNPNLFEILYDVQKIKYSDDSEDNITVVGQTLSDFTSNLEVVFNDKNLTTDAIKINPITSFYNFSSTINFIFFS